LTKLTVEFAGVFRTHQTRPIFTVLANAEEITTEMCLGILKFTGTQNIRL